MTTGAITPLPQPTTIRPIVTTITRLAAVANRAEEDLPTKPPASTRRGLVRRRDSACVMERREIVAGCIRRLRCRWKWVCPSSSA